jgi:hypothetical protein
MVRTRAASHYEGLLSWPQNRMPAVSEESPQVM